MKRLGMIRAAALVMFFCSAALAKPYEVRLPLHRGRLRLADLSAALSDQVALPRWHVHGGEVNFNGWRGSIYLAALNAALDDGCRVSLSDQSLIVDFDPEKLPQTVDRTKKAIRAFVAAETPRATAAQARHYGLFLPAAVDPRRKLVVLIHGLSCDSSMLHPMGSLLERDGYQVAYFCYPADQPIEDSVALLENHLAALHESFPLIRLDLVAHSMGGLVSRAYVEGNDYGGDVDHLILVGTPNDGSRWAKFHVLLKAQQEYEMWQHDPDFHWSWMITDGLGEAARDVTPQSVFLKRLNAFPRREGVRYTVIAGSHSATATFKARVAETLASAVPATARNGWLVGPMWANLERRAEKYRDQVGDSDGPVTVRSARLKDVADTVILPVDHATLFCGSCDQPPAAYDIIRNRLAE